ncbi:MAG: Calx-beta domain-containing protein [Verrucomicrobiota bacterium]
MKNPKFSLSIAVLIFLGLASSMAFAQQPVRKHFGKGNPFTVEELPEGKLKAKLKKLDPQARGKAMKWLHRLSFQDFDAAEHLRVDNEGGIYVVCPDEHGNCDGKKHKHAEEGSPVEIAPEQIEEIPSKTTDTPTVEAAAVSVSSPPIYNSKPGATNHIYLDFNGALVSGKFWSESDGVTTWNSWDCAAWSTDGDTTTFSDSEQTEMRRVWERIAEDYAPFDVNVTTDAAYDSVTYTGDKNKVGWLLFTPTTDKLGARCPHYGSGGVAYVGVFGNSNYFSAYQPAWVTITSASNMAEAASHEMGHNMGLNHDGTTAPASYYGGHAGTAAAPSWGPIMGTGYGQNVSQWSKGEYYNSAYYDNPNLYANTQDDLATISSKVPYRVDDHGNSSALSSPLSIAFTTATATGIVERTDDRDVFSFTAAAGNVSFTASTFRSDASTWGGNLDILLELRDSSNTLLASANPAADTHATLNHTLPSSGVYYIHVVPIGAGTPLVASPNGYTSYGSLGKYSISGTIVPNSNMLVTSPNGGNLYLAGGTATITWASVIGGNVSIEILNGNAVHSVIAASTPNDGTFDWAIPAGHLRGPFFKIRVTSLSDGTKVDTSDNYFIISDQSSFYSQPFNTNPGWTLGSTWSYGPPTGGSTPRPTAGFTGANVLGDNLAGNYADSLAVANYATTTAIDCSDYGNVQLSFYRWLRVESADWDDANLLVSNNGIDWTEIWHNPTGANIEDTGWTPVTYDISTIADGQPTVYIRWGIGPSDTSVNFAGWHIDDLSLSGIQTNFNDTTLAINVVATSVAETAGAAATTGTVTRLGTIGSLVISLASNDTSEITVPASVTIADGQTTSAPFNLTAVDDLIIDGPQTVTITASSSGYFNGTDTITVTDNDNTPPSVNAGTDQAVVLTGSIWLPSDLPSQPLTWYDATDPASVILSSGVVSQWSDKTATGAHLIQGTAANRPTSGTTINGRNSIAFDGVNDGLKSATNPFGTTINNAFMASVVDIGNLSNTTMFSLSGSSTNANRWQAHSPYSDGVIYFDCGGSTGSNRISGASGWAANQNKILGFYNSVSASAQEVWANGTRILNDATGHAVTTSSGISLGFDGTSSYDQVRFGETVIINGTISNENRQKLEGYLAHKWAMLDTLPADHPYKTLTPSHSSVVATLNGTVTDPNPQTLTTAWSVVSGPGAVTFANASSIDTTATFTLAGTYVLRLSANDGFDTTLDQVTITVNGTTYPVTYNANSAATGTVPTNQTKVQDTPLTLAINSGNLARPGYIYAGWNTAADGSGIDYGVGAPYAANAALPLYAKWNIIAFPITQSSGTTVVAESAGTDTFTVALNTQPTTDVVISVTSNNTAEATVNTSTLTFTALNWAAPQTVTVTGVGDSIDRDDTTTITLSIVDASSDDIFDPVPDQTVNVTCTDDDTVGFTVTQTSGTTVVGENAGTDTFTVRLNSQPLSDVVVSVTSNSAADTTVSPATLTFTSANWNTNQTVTVTGVNDFFDRNDSTTMTLSIVDASSENTYDPVADQSVAVTCTDDDAVGFTYAHSSSNTTVAENAGTDTFTVKLNSQPLSDVVVSVTSVSAADATVSPATLTFTPANWNTNQTVTVTGVNDFFDRNDTTTITLGIVDASSENTYDPVADQSVAVTCTDDDAVGFTVTQSGGNTTVLENAGTDSFTVRLSSEPSSNVVINVANSSPADATVNITTLTFTSINWATDQTVTATAVNDNIDRNDTSTVTLSINAASSDNAFDLLANQTVTVTCTDDDTAGVTVTQTGGTTVVAENAGTDIFTVALSSQPLDNVVIGVVSTSTADATVSPATLTFTSANWSTPQAVTVTGVNDNIDRNDSSTITLLTDDTATLDATYDPLSGATVSVTCSDDDTAGINVAESGGNTVVAENAGTDTFTVTLNSEPTGNVVVSVVSTADATVSPASLTFTTADWTTPQTITVTGVNDNYDRDDTATITITTTDATTIDATYDPVVGPNVTASCTDDDTAGFVFGTITGNTAEPTAAATFTVRLNAQPTANVVIPFSSSDTTEGTVTASLTFSTTNWATNQTVTVAGVDDTIVDGSIAYTIVTAAATSTDLAYNGLDPADMAVTNNDNDKPTVAVTATDATATESGLTTAVLTFTRSSDIVRNAVTVFYTVSGTASAYADYQTLYGSVTIPAGQDMATVTLFPLDDGLSEAAETVIVTLTLNAAYNVGGAPATASIHDDEQVAVTVAATDATASEPERADGNGVFAFTRTGDNSADLTVNYFLGGTSTNGGDYTTLTGTVTILAGQSVATVTVAPVNDTEQEFNETVILNLSPGAGYLIGQPASATVTINEGDAPVVSVTATDNDVRELTTANAGTYTITRTGSTLAALTVNYTMSGTATNGTDYASLTGTATIAANASTAVVTLTPTDDALSEGNETAIMTLASGTGYTVGTPNPASLTIGDGELPIISFGTSDLDAAEPSASNGYFRLARAAATTAVTVNYTISGTATSGSDFTAVSGSITFPSASTQQDVTISVLDDVLSENPETVVLTISSNAAYSITGPTSQTLTLRDNENTVTLAATDATATEAGDTGTFRFTKPVAAGAMTVNYTIGGTALNGTDYASLAGSITIPNGQTFADLTITPNTDFIYDPTETVTVTLTANGTAYSIGTLTAQAVNITDTTGKPTIKIFAPDSAAIESPLTTAYYSIQLSHQAAANTTVSYAVSGTATSATDYTALTGSVTVNAGIVDQKFTLTPVADGLTETPETVTITLNTSANYDIGSPTSATALILDSDIAGFNVTETGDNTTVAENAGTDIFTVTLNTQPTSNVVIQVVSNSTADATVSSAALTFTPANWYAAQTITVMGVSDMTPTDDSAIITLSVDDSISDDAYDPLVNQSVTVTCVDNDLKYNTWTSESYARPFTDTATTANPDGDNLINLQEFAFGMDPTLSTTNALGFVVGGEVTQPGVPVLRFAASKYHAVFARRKDYVAAGLTYTAEFSADLKVWTSSAAGLSVLTVAGPSQLEAVSIEFPTTVPIQGSVTEQAPKFFRIGVQNN